MLDLCAHDNHVGCGPARREHPRFPWPFPAVSRGFRRGVTEELQHALDSYVANVLRQLGINEPVMWAPSRREATLAAPGRELGDIDWPILHALRQRGSTDSRLAKELHRSPRHARWAGDLRPHQATANAVKLDRVSITDSDVEPNPPRATL